MFVEKPSLKDNNNNNYNYNYIYVNIIELDTLTIKNWPIYFIKNIIKHQIDWA